MLTVDDIVDEYYRIATWWEWLVHEWEARGTWEGYVVEVRQARGGEVLVWDPQPTCTLSCAYWLTAQYSVHIL